MDFSNPATAAAAYVTYSDFTSSHGSNGKRQREACKNRKKAQRDYGWSVSKAWKAYKHFFRWDVKHSRK